MLSGAAGSTLVNSGNAFVEVIQASNFWDNPPKSLGKAGLAALTKATASLSMAQRAMLAFDTNNLYDSRFGAQARITDAETIYMMFTGGQPSSRSELFKNMSFLQNSNEDLEAHAKVLASLMNQYAMEKDPEERKAIGEAISVYSHSVGDHRVPALAFRKVHSGVLSDKIEWKVKEYTGGEARSAESVKIRENKERNE
jgi:hypothetical protein